MKSMFNNRILTRIALITSFVALLTTSIIYIPRTTSEGLEAYGNKETYDTFSKDDDFFRVDQEKYILNTNNLSNDNIYHNYNSTYFYNTMTSGSIAEVIEYFNVVNDNNSVGYNGFNGRSSLNAINNVKYLIVRNSENIQIPYGFTPYENIQLEKFILNKYNYDGVGFIEHDNGNILYEDATIYLNTNFLNFGFVYDEYVYKDELEDFNHVKRESVLLDAIILEKEIDGIKKAKINNNIEYIDDFIFDTNNLKISDNYIKAYKNCGKIYFTIDNIENHELYLELSGIRNIDKYKNFTIKYKANNHIDYEHNFGYGTNFYIDNSNHLLQMGYYQNEKVVVEIEIPEGEYEFSRIGYYLNPISEFDQKIKQLNSNTLQNLEFNNSGFSGTISLEKKGILFISLPFSNGFKAFIDGKEVEIHKANIGYMGIEVDRGNHKIEFVYQTPGLFWGINISILVSIIIVIIFWHYAKNKAKKRTIKNGKID